MAIRTRNRHMLQVVWLSTGRKRAAGSIGAYSEPRSPRGWRLEKGLVQSLGSHHGPCTTIRISWVLCGHKGNVDVFLCQSWRSIRAGRQTMPAQLTSHGLGATICFAKATVWNSWLNSRSPYGGASPVLPSRRADYRSPQSTPSSWAAL